MGHAVFLWTVEFEWVRREQGVSDGLGDCLLSVDARSFLRSLIFFFFQAEDGIRDLTVTGVQTCALPILLRYARAARAAEVVHFQWLVVPALDRHLLPRGAPGGPRRPLVLTAHDILPREQIGRASCRERV